MKFKEHAIVYEVVIEGIGSSWSNIYTFVEIDGMGNKNYVILETLFLFMDTDIESAVLVLLEHLLFMSKYRTDMPDGFRVATICANVGKLEVITPIERLPVNLMSQNLKNIKGKSTLGLTLEEE